MQASPTEPAALAAFVADADPRHATGMVVLVTMISLVMLGKPLDIYKVVVPYLYYFYLMEHVS